MICYALTPKKCLGTSFLLIAFSADVLDGKNEWKSDFSWGLLFTRIVVLPDDSTGVEETKFLLLLHALHSSPGVLGDTMYVEVIPMLGRSHEEEEEVSDVVFGLL